MPSGEFGGIQKNLEEKEAELLRALRTRDDIVIEKARTKWMRFNTPRKWIWRF
jgi:hypothetical protein